MTATCERCGHELQVGEWPFCPHGWPIQGLTVIPDDIPGGVTVENLGPTPVTFYTRSAHRAYLQAHGLTQKVRHVGLPGTDKSPHTQRWV